MTASRVVRVVFALLLLIALPSLAFAATTDFRVLFDVDDDDTTGCTVNGMDGVDQVLVTQVTEGDGTMRVTRTHREVCTGSVLGGPTDIVTTGWDAGWNNSNKLLSIETRIPFTAFGSEEMPSTIHVGFDASRNGSVHTSLANQDGSPIHIPEPPARRRAIGVGPDRHITMDGALLDWGNLRPAVIGLASNGSQTLRLLRIIAWPDPADGHLYFAATAYLGSLHPYADDNMYLRQPGQSLSIGTPGVLDNDGIPGGAPLTAEKVSDPARGTVTLNADGSFTYSPTHPQLLSDDEFEYKAVGAGKESNVARVIIQVDQNQGPNAPQDDAYSTPEDTQKVVPAATGVLVNDPHADFLVATLFSAPSHGSVVLNADGGFTYTPQANFFGTDSFVYTAAKKLGAPEGIGGNANVTITVTPVNDAPVIDAETFTIPENSPNNTVVGTVDAFDIDNNALTFSIVGGNTGGAFSINASTGQIRVANTAALDFETNPTFLLTVRVEDADDQDQATITINLTDTNEPPVIVAGGTLTYTENDPPSVIDGSLTVTDTDSAQLTGATAVISANFVSGQDVLAFTPVGAITGVFSGNTLTLSGADTPANYQLALRSVTYQNTSDNPSIASRTITWTATDGVFTSLPVTSTVNVISVNDEPSFAIVSDPPASNEDAGPQTVNGFASSISYGPEESGQDPLTFTLTPTGTTGDLAFSTGPAIDSSGNLTYTASPNTNGTATFNVVLTDSGSNTPPNDNTSATLSFTITVNPVNDPPTFSLAGNVSVNEDAGAQNVPGQATSISVGPANESAQTITSFNVTNNNNALFLTQPAIDTTGTLTYQTNPNLNGVATVSVTATDSGGATSSPAQTFTITVNPINDEPTFAILADPPASNEDAGAQVVNGLASSISMGPADEATQTGTFALTPTGTTGDLAFSAGPSIDPSGNLTYTASANTNGTATFNVVLTDSGSNVPPNDNTSATLSFTITVNAVNDPPTFNLAGDQTIDEDAGPQTVNGFASSISVGPANEGAQTITAFTVTNDNNALFLTQPAIDTAGNLTYQANANLNGMATVSVTATDSGGATSSPAQTFIITVNAVNDEPTFAILADPPASNEDAGLQTVNGFASSISTGPADEAGQSVTFTVTPNGSTGDLAFSTGPSIDSSGNLTYTASADTFGTATFNVVLTDGGSNTPPNDNTSATLSFTITVNAVNDPPTFDLGADQSVAEDSGLQTVNGFASSISVGPANESAQTITSFNVSNNNNPLFSVQPAIDTAGNLTYTPAPNAFGSAAVSVSATDSGGATSAPDQIFTITVNAVNDVPVVAAGAALNYTENQAPTAIDTGLTISDVDSMNLTGATVQITTNFASGEDVLSFTNMGAITFVSYTGGVLTLTGTTSVANYQAALRTVAYSNTSDTPSPLARTISWQVSDGVGSSIPVTSTVNVTPVNDAPVVNAASSLGYTEGTGAVTIDGALTTSDVDDTQYSGATVQITANYVNGEDILAFVDSFGITGAWNAATGTLTLSGTTSIANYQSALRTITYQNTSTNPSVAPRTVTWTVNDIAPLPGTDTTIINITPINSAPTIGSTALTPTIFTEDGAPVQVDATLNVGDADTATLAGATVTISANYSSGNDVLQFVNTPNITGVFNAGTGTLTLSGTDTVANYQTALRSVTFENTSDDPTTLQRTIDWQVDDGEAVDNLSSVLQTALDVAPVNDPPVVNAAANINYTEDAGAVVIDNALTVTDVDDVNLTGGTVQITANYASGEDVLAFTNAFGITGVFNAGTGTLTLSGTTTVANYQSALRTITYENTSQSPSTAVRTVTWTVNDGTDPGSDTTTITVSSVNDAPALTVTGAISYTENGAAMNAATAANITDADDTNIESATIQITGNYANGQDVLSYATALGITGVFTPATGTLTLTGSTTLANYITALQNVQYVNTSDAPSTLQRTLTWTVNDGDTNSNSQTTTVSVTDANDAPVNSGPAAAQVTNEDVPLTFNAANSNQLSISDADAGAASIQVTLSTLGGTISVGGPATVSNNGTATVTVTGTVTAINSSLSGGVVFNPTPNTSGATQLTMTTDDLGATGTGGAQQDTDNYAITVNNVNDAPVLTVAATPTPTYTENGAAIAIATSATISDIDDVNIESATVQITGNYDMGGDVLSYTTALGITGVFTPATGTLALSGSSSLANYQTALLNVMFVSTSENPSALQRTVTWTVNDGDTNSNSQTTNINIVNVNDPPAINANDLAYLEGNGAVAIDATLTVTDADDTSLPSATVQITANYVNGEDILAFTNAFGITGNFAAATGTLTLTGPASPADFQSALRTVTYENNSNNPSASPRTITWTVNDDEPSSGTDTTTITVTPTNDPPVLTLTGTLNYTENDPATNVAATATVTDVDDTNIESATIQITTNYANGQDVLSYTTALGISGVFTAATGTLQLTGSATLADYQTALLNVQYTNTSENPSTAARTVTWTVNDGDTNSNSQTSTINVTSVNDAPVVTPTGTPLTYTENDPATAVQPLITVSDVDSPNLTGATIQITANYQNGQDVLSYVTALGITGVFNAGTGTLTLSGTTTVANYQTALRNVLYNNTSENPSQLARTVAWQVNDGAGVNNLSTVVNSTINVIAVNDAPTVVNNTFDVIGNTELRVDMVAGTTPHAAETVNDSGAFQGVLFNDSDVEGDPFTITAIGNGCTDAVAPFDCTLGSGAIVHVDANGEFSFTPGPGDTTDSFMYTVTDTPVVGTAASNTGTVTFTFFEMVWYVRQGSAGNGTSIAPFGNFDDLDGVGGAGDLDDAADYIFVHHTGTPLAASATIPLEINQHVLGEAVSLSIPVNLNGNGSPTNLVAPGSQPAVTLAAGDLFTIGAAMPVEIRGLALTSTAGNVVDVTTAAALSGSAALTISNNTINGAGAEGFDVNLNAVTSGTLALAITNNAWNTGGTHTGTAIDVARAAGTLNVDVSNNTNILSTGTSAISINGAITITGFNSNTIHGNTVGQGVFINNATFDASAAAGYTTVNGGTMTIGQSGNGVGTAGLTLQSVSGDLAFTDLDIFNDGGNGFFLDGNGAVNVGAGTGTRVTVNPTVATIVTSGPGVTVSDATIDLRLAALTVSTASIGVSLSDVSDGTSAALFSAPSGSSLTATGGIGPVFSVAGGNAGVSYGGTITNNGTGRAVSVTTWAGDDATDDMTFSGAIDENGAGILLNANAGSRLIAFTGGLDIDTTTGEGFAATSNTNSLGLNITGSTNDITSVSAAALRVTNSTIGAGDLTFRNVSSGNNTAAADPANGIVLNATGSLGSLIVTGTGAAGSGGTIQNTTSDAITLTATDSPSFTSVNVTNTGGQGVNTNNMTNGFTLASCAISNTGDGDNEHALKMLDISGTVAVQGTSFTNTAEDFFNVDSTVANNSQLIMNIGTTTACTFTQPNTLAAIRAGGAFAGNGILVQHKNSKNYTINLSNSTFTNIKLTGIQVGSSGSSSTATNVNVNLNNNDFLVTVVNSLGNPNNRSNGINIQALNTLDIDASITNNELDGGGGGGIQLGADQSASLNANITGNIVSDQFADGILMAVDESATLTVLIDNNQISNTSSDGMEIANAISPDALNATLNATITNNTVTTYNTNVGANAFVGGIAIFSGASAGDNTRLDIRNNNVSGSPSPSYVDYWIDGTSFGDAIEMKGAGVAAVTEASFLAQPNTAGSPAGQKTFISNTFYNNNAAIPTPTLTP